MYRYKVLSAMSDKWYQRIFHYYLMHIPLITHPKIDILLLHLCYICNEIRFPCIFHQHPFASTNMNPFMYIHQLGIDTIDISDYQ